MRAASKHPNALRAHAQLLPALVEWTDEAHAALDDVGYEGVQAAFTTPVKKLAGRPVSADERTVNAICGHRAIAERGNALLKTTFKALRRGQRDHRHRSGPAPPRARPHYMMI